MSLSAARFLALFLISVDLAQSLPAQDVRLRDKCARLNDSTNCVDVPWFGVRVTYPRPDNTWDDPRAYNFDGMRYLHLSNASDSIVIIFETRTILQARLDSMAARAQRREYGSGDEGELETPAHFDLTQSNFQNSIRDAKNCEYLQPGVRKYRIYTYDRENLGTVIEFATFIDELRITIRVRYTDDRTMKVLQEIRQSTIRDAGSRQKVDELWGERVHRYLLARALYIVGRIHLDKIR